MVEPRPPFMTTWYYKEMAARSKAVAKVIGTLRVRVPAGGASPSPPLGPALGQVRVCVITRGTGEGLCVITRGTGEGLCVITRGTGEGLCDN